MITDEIVDPLLVEFFQCGSVCSVDTETTGLYSFKDDRLFSIILSSDGTEDLYLNFQDYPNEGIKGLTKEAVLKERLKAIFEDTDKVWFLQNAKFDMHMLAREGFFIEGKIHDTAVLDRILFNQHMKYSLAEITKRHGDHKLDIVWDFIEKNKLKTPLFDANLDKEEIKPHFDRVPFSIIEPYGKQDGRATLNVGRKILKEIKDLDAQTPNVPPQMQVVENESRLVKTLFRMERRGVKIDLDYCNEALEYYRELIDFAKHQFKQLTGLDFVKGTTVFEEVFASEKHLWKKTTKDNWCWDADIMESFSNPAAKIVIQYAEAKKQFEYFANFLYYSDSQGVIHPDFKQGGTVTGRLSCMNPNLQNLSNPDKYEVNSNAAKYSVRRSFIPREGFFFAMIDYSQVEFRILLDVAKANSLINEVLNGHDVHTATANVSGTSRKEAKTTNFLTVYGGGVVKLANGLFTLTGTTAQQGAIYKDMFGWRMSAEELAASKTLTKELRDHNAPLIRKAYDIQQSIFKAAPEIKDLLKSIQRTAETRGYIRNWLGRRYYFTDKAWAYRAPNHYIQGGAAEVIKIAMNRVDEYLLDKKSKLILSIHDELVIEVAYGEEFVIDEIKKIMESIYPYKRLPLLVDVEYSTKNLADKEAWVTPS